MQWLLSRLSSRRYLGSTLGTARVMAHQFTWRLWSKGNMHSFQLPIWHGARFEHTRRRPRHSVNKQLVSAPHIINVFYWRTNPSSCGTKEVCDTTDLVSGAPNSDGLVLLKEALAAFSRHHVPSSPGKFAPLCQPSAHHSCAGMPLICTPACVRRVTAILRRSFGTAWLIYRATVHSKATKRDDQDDDSGRRF